MGVQLISRSWDLGEVCAGNQLTSRTSRIRIGLHHRPVLKEAEMESQELDRIRFVTRHFNDLQGLRYMVPLGLMTLSVGGTTHFSSWPMVLRGAFILAALVLMLRAKAYYRRTLGEVEPAPAYAEELESFSFSPVGP